MIIPGLELWHMLLPGYIIALGLQFIVPNVFVGMAFDAGGVATGPLTATFILAFASEQPKRTYCHSYSRRLWYDCFSSLNANFGPFKF